MEKEKKEKTNELEKKVNTLTMCVVVMGVLLLSLGGYLLYDKVGSKSNAEGTVIPTSRSSFSNGVGYKMFGVIMDNDVPIYDSEDPSARKQFDTLNRGDTLYNCFRHRISGTNETLISCHHYSKFSTANMIDKNIFIEDNLDIVVLVP